MSLTSCLGDVDRVFEELVTLKERATRLDGASVHEESVDVLKRLKMGIADACMLLMLSDESISVECVSDSVLMSPAVASVYVDLSPSVDQVILPARFWAHADCTPLTNQNLPDQEHLERKQKIRERKDHEAKMLNESLRCVTFDTSGKVCNFNRNDPIFKRCIETPFSSRDPRENIVQKCAHPSCTKTCKDRTAKHLQLCVDHTQGLHDIIDEKLSRPGEESLYSLFRSTFLANHQNFHSRLYEGLLPTLDKWSTHINRLVDPSLEFVVHSTPVMDAVFWVHLRPVSQLLLLFKSFIFLYRMHLNPDISVMSAIIVLVIQVIQSDQVRDAAIPSLAHLIRDATAFIDKLFAYFGIVIIYTASCLMDDDAYLGAALMVIGIAVAATATEIATGVAAAAVTSAVITSAAGATIVVALPPLLVIAGIGSTVWGGIMLVKRWRRGTPDPELALVHIELCLARTRLWQWIREHPAM